MPHTRTATFLSRTLGILLAVVVAATGFAVAPIPAAAAYPSFTFTGSGYGHGIGLSQYGAKGFAEKGRTGEWIATYYFPGSGIGEISNSNRSRDINIDKGKTAANNGFARTSWSIKPGYVGSTLQVAVGGTVQATLDEAEGPYIVTASGSTVKITKKTATGVTVGSWSGVVTITPQGGSAPQLTQVTCASGPYGHTNVRYRGGLLFSASSGSVKCVNRLPMQEYLYGVVPRESPASWHIEALRAQAIVARSYSVITSGELYCTTSSQVYNGHSKINSAGAVEMHEDTRSNQAVDSTNGKYVLYQGNVIQTFFHSSSGGHTANIEDIWEGTGLPSKSNPYYTGVSDPYCAGPYDPWTGESMKRYDGMTLAKALSGKGIIVPSGAGSKVYVRSLAPDRAWPSGFVRKLDIVWSDGSKTSGVDGDAIRGALGLRSNKFFVNGMYTRVSAATRYETALQVSRQAYPVAGSAKAVVIVNGADDRYPDSLTGSALAGVAQGPVLLVQKGSVPAGVLDEIRRLGVNTAYVIGGEAAVASNVFNAIRSTVPDTRRLAGGGVYGTDRYGTAASVAMEIKALGGDTSQVLIASGENWPDAAVAASVGAGSGHPLLLVREAKLPDGTAHALSQLGATKSAVFGGPAVISDATLKRVLGYTHESAPARRFGASGTRYDMAVGAAAWCSAELGYTASTVYIASGETFIDSVTGGVLSGNNRFPLLLTSKATASKATCAYLDKNCAAIRDVIIIGGPAAVTDMCASTLASYAY